MGEPLRSKKNGRTLERFFKNNRTKWRKGKSDLEKLYQVKKRERWSGTAAPLRDFSRTAAPSEGRGKVDLEKLYQVKKRERWSGTTAPLRDFSRTAAPSEGRGKVIWRSCTKWRKEKGDLERPHLSEIFQNSRTKWRKGKGDLEKPHQVKIRERWSETAAPLRDFSIIVAPSEGRGKVI